MLTADLVRARRQGDELKVTELSSKQRPRALELARDLVILAEAHVGRTRAELEEALSQLDVAPNEQKLALALRKLVEDRLAFEVEAEHDPRALRSQVFEAAASARRALGPGMSLDREALLTTLGEPLGLAPDALLRALYADLRKAQVITEFAAVTPEHLVAGYDLAQKQAVLLRAQVVTADVSCRDAYAYRALFRKLKFLRLLHRIEAREDGYRIVIDGPFSLFSSAQKYGLELALALPSLLSCDVYKIAASVRWGKERVPLTFTMEGRGRPEAEDESPRLPDEVAALLTRFSALESGWDAAPASDILTLPGIGLCVPDLRFVHRETGEIAYLEVMGYWSRAAVWKRVELCERGLSQRVVFAVSSRLRVSEEVLGDEVPSELYVYKGSLSAREVLRRLDRA